MGHILALTSSEVLIDSELTSLLGEDDRGGGTRRVDLYLIHETGTITLEVYRSLSTHASKVAFLKTAHACGLLCGASVKSDFSFSHRRSTSGELHLEHCPITFFAIPHVNERSGTLSDVLVLVNVRSRFSVTTAGKIQYSSMKRTINNAVHGLPSIDDLRYTHRQPEFLTFPLPFLPSLLPNAFQRLSRPPRQCKPREHQGQDGARGLA